MIKHIFDYIDFNSSILIAYSGGIDSTVLLHQCINIKKKITTLNIRAIHINHNIHEKSKDWALHCQNQCYFNNIPLITASINRDIKNNVECQLRYYRYNLIKKYILKNEILFTGHHLDDNVETILLALKRGSGPNGLKGIVECSKFGNNRIIRPLLQVNRKSIKNWAKTKKLSWIVDDSNYQTKYDRNFLRKNIIPLFNKRWEYFSKNCITTAKICEKTEKFIKKTSTQLLFECKLSHYSLDISNFHNISNINYYFILREWIFSITNKHISYKKIKQIQNEVVNSKKDSNPKLIFHNYQIRRYQKILYCIPYIPSIKNLIVFWHDLSTDLQLPFNLGVLQINRSNKNIKIPQKDELVNIRFQFQGKISVKYRKRKRSFKKILQELKIPTWKREIIPLLFYNNTFISAIETFTLKRKICKNDKFFDVTWNSPF